MAEGGPVVHGRLFGLPAWAAILTLGAAGVVGYLLFFRAAKKPGYGTTGYSPYALAVMQNPDESASISLMNQELYGLKNTLEGGLISLQGAEYSNQGALQSIQGALTSNQGALTSIQGGLTGIQGGLTSLQGAAINEQASQQAYYNSLQNTLSNYQNALSTTGTG